MRKRAVNLSAKNVTSSDNIFFFIVNVFFFFIFSYVNTMYPSAAYVMGNAVTN